MRLSNDGLDGYIRHEAEAGIEALSIGAALIDD